jgi:succinate dehydrogenase hydrophobic membrane anchor protein
MSYSVLVLPNHQIISLEALHKLAQLVKDGATIIGPKPVSATAMGLLVISAFWHARLGMQVMVEDYVHEHGTKFACVAALNLAAFGGAAFGLLCVVRIALGAPA